MLPVFAICLSINWRTIVISENVIPNEGEIVVNRYSEREEILLDTQFEVSVDLACNLLLVIIFGLVVLLNEVANELVGCSDFLLNIIVTTRSVWMVDEGELIKSLLDKLEFWRSMILGEAMRGSIVLCHFITNNNMASETC